MANHKRAVHIGYAPITFPNTQSNLDTNLVRYLDMPKRATRWLLQQLYVV